MAQGHPWIYRNELPDLPPAFPPGELIEVADPRGRFVGIGYCNPKSVITIRLLTRERETIDRTFFRRRIEAAIAYRERFYPGAAALRLIYGESDFLPGLILDRYGPYLVMQVLTAGMERQTGLIVSVLEELLAPQAIIARNDVQTRSKEGLPLEKKLVAGKPELPVTISKGGLEFEVDLMEGQKTGFFLDQSENYLQMKPLVADEEVLDTFCYSGAWALHAARFGAKTVVGIDASEGAIGLARRNAARNGLGSVCRFETGNVFDLLKAQEREGKRYGCLILDPPSFVKKRKEVENAVRGYKEINLRAMKLLRPGGFLISCSCSYHLSQDRFRQILAEAAHDAKRVLRLIAFQSQAKDHPVLLSHPETEYLKCAVLQVL